MKCDRDDFRLSIMLPHHHRHIQHDDSQDRDLKCFACYKVIKHTQHLVLRIPEKKFYVIMSNISNFMSSFGNSLLGETPE